MYLRQFLIFVSVFRCQKFKNLLSDEKPDWSIMSKNSCFPMRV